jgi:hypothetical protein
MRRNRSGSRGLLVIAAFKLLKALLLLAVGIGALNSLLKNTVQLQLYLDCGSVSV